MCASSMAAPVSRQMKLAPRAALVPFLAASISPLLGLSLIVNVHVILARSTIGLTTASWPGFCERMNDDASGTKLPFARGSGLGTVRAQSHAMTLAFLPSLRVTLG